MNIYEEAIEKIGKNKTIQFMCKHDTLDVDFTPKTMECFVDILHNDDNSYHDETDSYNYEEQSEKDVRFFEGETVKYGDYYCYIKIIDDVVIQAITRAKKVEELLGLYKQRDYLLNNKPKTKYQIDVWKQRLKNNQYAQECLVKELEEKK